jgi:CRP/FNR family transcriptional regulator
MDDIQIRKLSQIARHKHYAAGQMILSDQEPVAFFANVISGTVKLTKTMPDGRQQIVGLLFPPDFLGRAFSRSNPYSAEAANDVELCAFPNAAFERLTAEYPDLQHKLFERTLDDLDAAREWMLLLGRKTAEEKVASFLAMLARRSLPAGRQPAEAPEKAVFELPLTRADMADYLGLTIETVSRQLTKLKTAKLIRIVNNRLIEVPGLEKLNDIAGQGG